MLTDLEKIKGNPKDFCVILSIVLLSKQITVQAMDTRRLSTSKEGKNEVQGDWVNLTNWDVSSN